MNSEVQTYDKDAQEKLCAQTFVDWLGCEGGVKYSIKRAEEVFPELGGHDRWDFVARQQGSPHWVAIEVKGLRFPPLLRDSSQWQDFLDQIKSQVTCKLPGTFLISNLGLSLGDRPNRTKLAKVIAELVLNTAPRLKVGEGKDINGDAAYRFRLSKLKDDGCAIEALGKLPFYPSDPIEREETEKDLKKAVSQLRIARSKGASRCVILLCSHPPSYDDQNLKESATRTQEQLREAVNGVFLVDVEQHRVIQLWPAS